MDTILVFEKEERYQYMIDTSTILNSMKSIKLFVKYTFNEQMFCFYVWITLPVPRKGVLRQNIPYHL